MTTYTSEMKFSDKVAKSVFNENKTDYESPTLFFGQERGLLDTINMKYPVLMNLYEELKGMDWKHNEYKYSECLKDFERVGQSTRDKMIKTLAWQWEADSIAGSSIIELLGPVISATEVRIGYTRIADNENLHALTYSEITRGSFENPGTILKEILHIRQALGRLAVVSQVFDRAMRMVYNYKLGNIGYSQDLYNSVMMVVCALYSLERIQFMQSFGVTFGICATGVFTNIGLAVQLICRDEFTNHVPWNQEILRIELATDRGQIFYKQCKVTILAMINAICEQEIKGIDYLYEDGKDIAGITKQRLTKWLLFNATVPVKFFGLQDDFKMQLIETNPMPFMENWIDIEATQSSNQEQDNNQYTVNAVSTTALASDYIDNEDF